MGANGPTIDSLQAVVPNVHDIDRSAMNAWADPKFQAAVKATGRERLVMCGISTSACLTYPVVSAMADGYEVTFIEDAVGDSSQRQHDTAVLRLAHAGAIPNTTVGMIALGNYSVHTSAAALRAGEQRLKEIQRRLRSEGRL